MISPWENVSYEAPRDHKGGTCHLLLLTLSGVFHHNFSERSANPEKALNLLFLDS